MLFEPAGGGARLVGEREAAERVDLGRGGAGVRSGRETEAVIRLWRGLRLRLGVGFRFRG